VLLRAESEGIDVDAGVRGAGVGEEGLDKVEVGPLALREPILTVELELSSNYGVLAPTVESKSGLGEDKGASVRNKRLGLGASATGNTGVGKVVRAAVLRAGNTRSGIALAVTPPRRVAEVTLLEVTIYGTSKLE
jgi:hypothetical protein